MLTFNELTLKDKPKYDRIVAQIQTEVSDLSFSNFYMWTVTYGLKGCYLPDLDYWLLLAKPAQWKPFFFPPLGDWSDQAKLRAVLRQMQQIADIEGYPLFIRRVPDDLLNAMLELEHGLEYREDRNTFDYLYLTQNLIELTGRKLHGKRNYLNQFLRKYQWSYQPMTQEIATECLALETAWFNLKEPSAENEAMTRMLSHFSQLGLTGAVIRVDGMIQALTVGEALNRKTAVIHIEKANTEFDGTYAAINQQFVANQWSGMEFINREEDMGLEGLRQVKLSYQPVRLVKKYNIYR